MSDHPNLELMRRTLAAFQVGDMAGLAELLAPQVVWHVPGRSPLAGDHRGRDEVFGFFGSLMELSGGTFSITNGGVFGSMLSTPIINPPQSAILGIHATKERPVVENGQIVIRPMNYLALSYDHRIIDGREAVLSLVAIKEALEDPARLLLQL